MVLTPRTELSLAAPYLRAAARKKSFEIVLHPDGAFAGQLRLRDGSVRYFVRSMFDLNPAGAAQVARDKALAKFFLVLGGFPVPEGKSFFSDRLCSEIGSRRDGDAARQYAEEIGYPVMVKANSGAAGKGIERASNDAEVRDALARAFLLDDVVLIESYKGGLRDYRILVLDGEVLIAYERRPFAVVGNGTATIAELVDAFGAVRPGRPDPQRLERALARSGLQWTDIPSAGESLSLVDVANLAEGGSAVEVTNELHLRIVHLAVEAARELGLRYAGVDILTDDATRGSDVAYILELNAAPTIHHFAALCGLSDERLEALHEKLLDALVEAR